MLVDGEDDPAVAFLGANHLLEVDVEDAGLGSRGGEGAAVGCLLHPGLGAAGAGAEGGGRGEVLGSVGRRVGRRPDLVDAHVAAPVQQLGGLCGREAADVRLLTYRVEAEGGEGDGGLAAGGGCGDGGGGAAGDLGDRLQRAMLGVGVGDADQLQCWQSFGGVEWEEVLLAVCAREDEAVDVVEPGADALLLPHLGGGEESVLVARDAAHVANQEAHL